MLRYTSVTNPRWITSQDKKTINCMVQFEHHSEPIPFDAWPYDVEPHGRQIYYECVFGLHGPIKEPEPKEKKTWLSALKKVVLGR